MIKSFSLGGKKYRVKLVNRENVDYAGLAMPTFGEIEIQEYWHGRPIPEDSQEQIFYHELVHCILDEMGRADLCDDETFVQGFSAFLHCFHKTKKEF